MTSLAHAVKQCKHPFSNGDVLLFKEVGEPHPTLGVNDFALGFMSKEQMEMWNKFSKRAVMMDSTYKFSRHNFKVFTILVIGPKEKGIPVATLVCNRENPVTMMQFFKAIEEVAMQK